MYHVPSIITHAEIWSCVFLLVPHYRHSRDGYNQTFLPKYSRYPSVSITDNIESSFLLCHTIVILMTYITKLFFLNIHDTLKSAWIVTLKWCLFQFIHLYDAIGHFVRCLVYILLFYMTSKKKAIVKSVNVVTQKKVKDRCIALILKNCFLPCIKNLNLCLNYFNLNSLCWWYFCRDFMGNT